jgi:PIN domain nuclease of toxin-antitoxin system
MRLLLDTHTFLWFIEGSLNLSSKDKAFGSYPVTLLW